MKNNKAITLISLVITIVVLVILSAVAINLTLGNNGILNKAEQAKNETTKQAATEKMNLKITNMQIEKYTQEQRMPTLQEFSDGLCADNEIEYVELESKKVGSLSKIEVGEAESIFTKLKEYPYEFEIDSSLKIKSVDGSDYKEENIDNTSTIIKNVTYETKEMNPTSIKIQANVETENEEDIKGYLVYVNQQVINVQEESLILIEGLENNTEYNIKCGAIDKEGKIKLSDEKILTTKENLYNGTNYLNRITGFTPFRVDTASSYPAYGQQNGYYQIIGIDANGRAGINTNEKVDLTNIKEVEADVKMYNGYGTSFIGTAYLGIYTIKDNTLNFTKFIQYSTNALNTSPESKKLKLDVSDITGEYYIKMISVHPSNISYYGFCVDIYSISLELNKEEIEIKNSQENKTSTIVNTVNFETTEVKDNSMKIQINTITEKAEDVKGYYIYVNGEIAAVNNESLVTIEGLEQGTVYNIKCGIIDKQGNIKESEERKIATLTSEVLYDGTNYLNRITGFTPFRVDTASSYTAYGPKNGYYQIIGLDINGRAGINTNEKVDLTNIKEVEAEVKMYNNYGSSFTGTAYLGIYTIKDNTLNFTKFIQYSTNALNTSPESKKLKLDVSDITGEYYIKMISVHPSNISYYGFVVDIYSFSLKSNTEI